MMHCTPARSVCPHIDIYMCGGYVLVFACFNRSVELLVVDSTELIFQNGSYCKGITGGTAQKQAQKKDSRALSGMDPPNFQLFAR